VNVAKPGETAWGASFNTIGERSANVPICRRRWLKETPTYAPLLSGVYWALERWCTKESTTRMTGLLIRQRFFLYGGASHQKCFSGRRL
jgi:hypothetical protein